MKSTINIPLANKLKDYSKRYLLKKYDGLDESATRLMVNHFLTEVLGFTELDEIKTEYLIKGTYADYVVQTDRKKHFVVEVKSIQLDLSDNHLRQALGYAANEGIDWIFLTNGKVWQIFRVLFTKPLECRKVFEFDLASKTDPKHISDDLQMFTRKGVLAKEPDKYWSKFLSLEPSNLAKLLYSSEVISFLRRSLKKKSGITFSEEDIIDSVYKIIVDKIPSVKPKAAKPAKKVSVTPDSESETITPIAN